MNGMVSKREAQLRTWHLMIARLASVVHGVGAKKDFDALVYLDELKVLHAIAHSKLAEYKAAGNPERRHLEPGLNSAWRDLQAAVDNLEP